MLTSKQLAKAKDYNKKASGKIWNHADLPSPWGEYPVGSSGFASETWTFQGENNLQADGCLGPHTLAKILPPKLKETTPKPDFNWPAYTAPTRGSNDGWGGAIGANINTHIWDVRNDPDLTPDKLRTQANMNSCIIHTTGYGEGLKRLDDAFKNDLLRIDEAYAKRLANILTYKAHFFIGRTGYTAQMAPLKYMTWHSAGSYISYYKQPEWSKTKSVAKGGRKVTVNVSWWPDRFPGLQSPLDLDAFKGGNINKNTWALDILAPPPGGKYTDVQHIMAARICHYVHTSFNLPLDTLHIMGHEDINPLDRSNARGGWDVGPEWDWEFFWKIVRTLEAEKA